MKNHVDFYNKKIIETATTFEIYEYEKPVFFQRKKECEKDIQQNKNNLFDDELEKEKLKEKSNNYQAIQKLQKYYENTRWEVARIVDTNFDDNTKFITLTFKENIQDIKYSNNEFHKFIKRLNYKLYKTKKANLKYLAVWETQKRGAIHYHIIFFDLPYIKNKELREIWKHGFVKINKIDVDSKENRGRYVSKYFSKDVNSKNYKEKSFFKSQNLKIPKITYERNYIDYDFSEESVVFTKEYSRQSPVFNTNDFDNYMTFKESKVKYTKIRKVDIK